jgi:hypothetical protein
VAPAKWTSDPSRTACNELRRSSSGLLHQAAPFEIQEIECIVNNVHVWHRAMLKRLEGRPPIGVERDDFSVSRWSALSFVTR